jgi:putative flippase GtrA
MWCAKQGFVSACSIHYSKLIWRTTDLVSKHHRQTLTQFVKYGFVAAAAFIVDFGLLYVFTSREHIYYLVSATLSFSISLVLNYMLSAKWVFPSQSTYRRSLEIMLFIIIGLVGLVLNLAVIWACTRYLHLYYLESKLVAIAIVFFWSFFARRYFIFRGQTVTTLEQP